MPSTNFAYHIKPFDFQGNQILPLSFLQSLHPEIANTSIKKYTGREDLIDRVVYDPTNSPHQFMGDKVLKWTEVSFCSMIDPSLIFKKFKELGFIPKEAKRSIFKISLEVFPVKTMVWFGQKKMSNLGLLPQDDCYSLEEAYNMVDINILPSRAVEYYESWQNQGKLPLFFVHTPHILCAEPIDISVCEIIEVA